MTTGRELEGSWIHAHEERDDGLVFVRSDVALPPSRGRRRLELTADGGFIEGTPGPVDRAESESGRWNLAGDELTLQYRDGTTVQYHARRDRERLILQPPSKGR